MKGLLWKDLKNLKQQMRIYAFMAVIWLVISVVDQDASFFSGLLMMLSVMIPLSALSYDERARWDRYALTMPVSRADLVVSKYLLGGVFILLGALFSVVLGLFLSGGVEESLDTALLLGSAGLFFLSLTLPLMFKFGIEKGRFLLIAIAFVPTALIIFLSKSSVPAPSGALLMKLIAFSPVLAAAAVAISLPVSLAVYRHKEF